MYIKIVKNKWAENVYLVEGYRNAKGKVKQRILKKYGPLSDLISDNPDAIEELKLWAKKKTNEANAGFTVDWKMPIGKATATKNYGYFFLESLYKDLGISKSIEILSDNFSHKYDLNSIIKMLVFGRILNPASKLETIEKQDVYFKKFENKLTDTYRSLEVMAKIKDDIQASIHKNILKKYDRDCSHVLYDVTNYYFESEKEDELKKPGVSKEKRKGPIVQMGLLIDSNKIPIGYKLFAGNTHDSKTAIPMIDDLRNNFDLKRVLFVADKGINTAKNFAYLAKRGDGYIVSTKIRGAKKEFINEVLNEDNYIQDGDNFKYKEILQERKVKNVDGKIVILKEKIVIFWSKKYDLREKYKREKLLPKIQSFIESPSKLKASNSFGVKKYIKTIKIDDTTGEVKKIKDAVIFNQAKYDGDVQLDGYYAIVTSEVDMPVNKIIGSYRDLWKIEESFKVIKSDLQGRPVYVRDNDHIEGHFLTCFIALVMLRVLEYKMKFKFTSKQIKTALKEANCKEFANGYYSMERLSDVIITLETLHDSFIEYRNVSLETLRKHRNKILRQQKIKH